MESLLDFVKTDDFLIVMFILVIIFIVLTIVNIIMIINANRKYLRFMKKLGNGSNLDEMLKEYLRDVKEIKQDNTEIKAYLYGVIGFSEIILRLLYHLDTELLTTQGENYFKDNINKKYKKKEMFSTDADKCLKQINRFCTGLGFMQPENPLQLKKYLIDNNLHY